MVVLAGGLMHLGESAVPDELVEQYSAELELGPIGLWHVVPRVTEQADGVVNRTKLREIILAMLGAGAVPVRHSPDSGYEWIYQPQYGTDRVEIADAILREWEPVPNDSFSLIEHCPWFARPDPAYPKYVKMD